VGLCVSSVRSSLDMAAMGSMMCVLRIFISHEYAHHDLGPRNGITIYISGK
jgi:hypothetical protein